MDDLVAWLRAQLDEDERIVMRAQTPEVTTSETPETWVAAPIDDGPDSGWQVLHHAVRIVPTGEPTVDMYTVVTNRQLARDTDRPVGLDRSMAKYVAEHDPARVLREIDAKRQLLAIHRPYVPERGQACLGCAGGIEFERCPVVRLLALPYADRPGYREDWRA